MDMHDGFTSFSLNLRGRLVEYDRPAVMGIVNATPDSFYASSRIGADRDAVARRVEEMVKQRVDIIDVGACSTRPGSEPPSEDEEIERLQAVLPVVAEVAEGVPLSVDTYRARVARIAVEELGATIINDVSGARADSAMIDTVAALHAPYILTHSRSCPATMQSHTHYDADDVTAAVVTELSDVFATLRRVGVADIIIDPGFGFNKTVEQNFRLLRELPILARAFEVPLLVGLSRKSMLTKLLSITPAEALSATVAANTVALLGGASILRVHDVEAARQAVDIVQATLHS